MERKLSPKTDCHHDHNSDERVDNGQGYACPASGLGLGLGLRVRSTLKAGVYGKNEGLSRTRTKSL